MLRSSIKKPSQIKKPYKTFTLSLLYYKVQTNKQIHILTVNKPSTGLVECGYETGVIVECDEYESVVFLMHLQYCRHVYFGILKTYYFIN